MLRWNLSALAAAALLSTGLHTTDAQALALGRIQVQSALGEPLRAEIELPQITPAEADSLRVAPATADAFRAQGLEFSSTAQSIQITPLRRANGSMVLQLSSRAPINEPFVDLVVDATWNSGHILRSYTMLFDPPALRRPQAGVTAAAQTAPPSQTSPAPTAARPAPSRPAASAPTAARPAATSTPHSESSVTVRSGDTAGRIAQNHLPAGVSLDQMLVALLRANPDAFIQGNVNRIRAGAVLQLPSQADAQAIPATEARQTIVAQSQDFNAFRRRLATATAKAQVDTASRSDRGSVQTQVQESKPAPATSDKLTLSKGGLQGQAKDEGIAHEREASQTNERLAELSKNIAELQQLGGSAASAPAATPAPAPAAPASPEDKPAEAASPSPAVPANADTSAEPASAPAETPAAEPAAEAAPAITAPVAPPAAKPAAAPPAPIEEPSLLDTLTEDPMLPGAALAIVLLLLGYGGWRYAQGRRNAQADDSQIGADQSDSFFNVSGGQRVDTASTDFTTGASSMHFSPSQLDAGGDVDPVAEADVYLAYGRHEEAEKILKEAARQHPERASIVAKLAEIYAKRQDSAALQAAARQVFDLTGGTGADWSRVAELGRTLDPANALYQPQTAATPAAPPPLASSTPEAEGPPSGVPSTLPDFDLDLDLELHDAPPVADTTPTPLTPFAAAAAGMALDREAAPAADASLDIPSSWDLGSGPATLAPDIPEAPPAPARDADDLLSLADTTPAPLETEPAPLEFDSTQLSLPDSLPGSAPATPAATAPAEPQSLEFDLGDLSLDLPPSSAAPDNTYSQGADTAFPQTDEPLPEDPMATKLALAAEFKAMGDSEGARALVEEVVAESSGDLQARARRMLTELG